MRTRALLMLGAAALAGGCSLLEKLVPPPATTPAAAPPEAAAPARPAAIARLSSADELVTYLARLKTLSEAALTAEATRQRLAAQRDPSDVGRVKAAMALVVAGQAEDADILAMVDPLARRDTADADVRAMASFLQGIAHERRRLKESAAAAGARLRDAQRARETEKQRAEALQERAAQLQQKLDALTDLEKSLSDRQNPTR